MSYEYKDEIIMNIKDYNAGRRVVTGGTNAFESKLTELDHVYAQTAKADEYEAKAKLADDIITAWKTGNFDFTEGEGSLPDHGIAPVPNYHIFDFGQYVDSLLDEYESGESNELRE